MANRFADLKYRDDLDYTDADNALFYLQSASAETTTRFEDSLIKALTYMVRMHKDY